MCKKLFIGWIEVEPEHGATKQINLWYNNKTSAICKLMYFEDEKVWKSLNLLDEMDVYEYDKSGTLVPMDAKTEKEAKDELKSIVKHYVEKAIFAYEELRDTFGEWEKTLHEKSSL